MPRCRVCQQEKAEEEFAWRFKALGIRQRICRSCRSEENRGWYERHREEHIERVIANTRRNREKARKRVYNYLRHHPCEECGESDPAVLEFHHEGEFDKFKEVSLMIAEGYSLRSIAQEINKCRVLCCNCHRKQTSKDQGWYNW